MNRTLTKNIRSAILLLLFLLFLSGKAEKLYQTEVKEPQISPTSSEDKSVKGVQIEESAKVTQVIDGDTIGLESGEKVRYIGVDTPEVSKQAECFSAQSKTKNEELVLGQVVKLKKDVSERDRYGRLLRYVWVGDKFVNETLVKEGFARVSTFPPDVSYQQVFLQAEKEARGKGIRALGQVFNSLASRS